SAPAPATPEAAATEPAPAALPSVPPETDSVTTVGDEPVQTAPTPGHFTVGISAKDRCWVTVVVDGQPTMQRELAPGESRTFEVRDTIVLTAGNAAALAVTLNGAEA